MSFTIRPIIFVLHRVDGTKQEITRQVMGDDEEVNWIAEQYADVNNCGVTASYQGNEIANIGNVQ